MLFTISFPIFDLVLSFNLEVRFRFIFGLEEDKKDDGGGQES